MLKILLLKKTIHIMPRKVAKNQNYWPSLSRLASIEVGSATDTVITYELGPTGFMHAGILRTIYHGHKLRKLISQSKKNVRFILRINDLVPEKRVTHVSEDIGYRLAIDLPPKSMRYNCAADQLENEITEICYKLNMAPPHFMRMSEIYELQIFQSHLERAMQHESEIKQILERYVSSKVELFYPLCNGCNRLHTSTLRNTDQNGLRTYACKRCSTQFDYQPAMSKGLITFKLELSLIWQCLKTTIDLHGQDHIEAFYVATELSERCEFKIRPYPARLNLSFNSKGNKVSKSNNNFTPVVNLCQSDLKALMQLIESTPYWQPMYLPTGF